MHNIIDLNQTKFTPLLFFPAFRTNLHQASASTLRQLCMTLTILFSFKTMESLQNGIATHFQATPLISMRAELQASLQSCRSVATDAWCKRVLRLLHSYAHLFISIYENILLAVNCPPLNLANGEVMYNSTPVSNDRLIVGTSASFTCQSGYSLSGSSSIICTNSGNWNEPLPTCKQGNQILQHIYKKIFSIFYTILYHFISIFYIMKSHMLPLRYFQMINILLL